MAKVTVGNLFRAYKSAQNTRVRRSGSQDKEAHASALAAETALSVILKGCETEVEVSDDRLNSTAPFLVVP